MKRILEFLLSVALFAAIVAMACGIAIEIEGLRWMKATEKRTDAILTHVDAVAARSQRTMEKIEAASQLEGQASTRALAILDQAGTLLYSTNETVQKAGLAVDQAGKAIAGIQSDADGLSKTANYALEQSIPVVGQMKLDLLYAQGDIESGNKAIQDIDTLIASPDVLHAIHGVALTASNTSDATAALSDSARHVDAYVARVTKPASAAKAIALHAGSTVLQFFSTFHIF